jgi:hypothetical protein
MNFHRQANYLLRQRVILFLFQSRKSC